MEHAPGSVLTAAEGAVVRKEKVQVGMPVARAKITDSLPDVRDVEDDSASNWLSASVCRRIYDGYI